MSVNGTLNDKGALIVDSWKDMTILEASTADALTNRLWNMKVGDHYMTGNTCILLLTDRCCGCS